MKISKKTAIADYIIILPDGSPEFFPLNNKFWHDYNERANNNIKMFYGLYKTGELENISEFFRVNTFKKDTNKKVVEFVIDVEKLTDEFVERMNKEYPENDLNTIPQMMTCYYTNCIGIAHQCYCTYRETDGIISTSFELPTVINLKTKSCCELGEIADKEGALQAGIALFKMFY